MTVTDSEIQLLSNDDTDLNENHVNIMRRLAIECNNDSEIMIARVSAIFVKSMHEDEDLQEIVDSIMMSLRYFNGDIRNEIEEKIINVGLHQLRLAFDKIIEFIPECTDEGICKILEEILDSDDFEETLLETAKESGAYADLMVTIANYQLEQYSSPALVFSADNNKVAEQYTAELNHISSTPNLLP